MLALISFLLVSIGCINWFSIGILQFDFVAGIFGSQSNIFSRLIYTLVGIASIVMIINFVTNKGKFVVSFKKDNEEFEEMPNEHTVNRRRRSMATESSEDFSLANALKKENEKNHNTESGMDNYKDHTTQSNYKNSNCECGKDTSRNKQNPDTNDQV